MSGFKMGASEEIVLKQRGGVIVYLESEEDFQVLAKRWFFDEGQDICFQPADAYEPGPGGGGCKAVIALVSQARGAGIAAFGLVDRDLLLTDHHWSLWWQEQDQVFLAARPYGDHIRVLVRWELENYLLDPDAMAVEANDAAMVSSHTADATVNRCLECANELKDRSAATVAAMRAGLVKPADAFGCHNPHRSGSDFADSLKDHLEKKGLTNAADAMTAARAQIERFDAPDAAASVRWDRLVRLLDGKAALKYLSFRTRTPFDERRAGLARRIYERGAIPSEIRSYIDDFKRVA